MIEDSQFTAQMAMDASLPPDLQARIAATRPDLLPWLAANPSLYPELRQWLAASPDPRVQAALAGPPAPSPSSQSSQPPKPEDLLPQSVPAAGSPALTQSASETSKPRAPRGRGTYISIAAAVVVLLAIAGAVFAWVGGQNTSDPGTVEYKGYQIRCDYMQCVGVHSSGEALILELQRGEATPTIIERELSFPESSSLYPNHTSVVSPAGADMISVSSGDQSALFQVPPDSKLENGAVLSDDGQVWTYDDVWGTDQVAEPKPLSTPWPVAEVLYANSIGAAVLGEYRDGSTPLAYLSPEGELLGEALIPAKLRSATFPFFLADDGSVFFPSFGEYDSPYPSEGESLRIISLDLPAPAVEVSQTTNSVVVRLNDGSVYAPVDLLSSGSADMLKLDLPGKASSVYGGLILLADGTVWMPEPRIETQSPIPIQPDLPHPAQSLMDAGWVMLENGEPVVVNVVDYWGGDLGDVYRWDPDQSE